MDELTKDLLAERAEPLESARARSFRLLLGPSEARTAADVLPNPPAIVGGCGFMSVPHDERRDARPMPSATRSAPALAGIADLAAIFDFGRSGEVASLQSYGITRRFI